MSYYLTHSIRMRARGRLKGTRGPLGETLDKNVLFLKMKTLELNGNLLCKNHALVMSDSPLH